MNAGRLDARPAPSAPKAQAQSPVQPASPAEDKPTHLYEAVSTQRENVLSAFDMQRNAILKAVADQRQAALAPIRAVQTRQAGQGSTTDRQPIPARPTAMPPAAAGSPQPQPSRQQLVAADIVVALKAIVAEEVRVQILILLEAARLRENARSSDAPTSAASE